MSPVAAANVFSERVDDVLRSVRCRRIQSGSDLEAVYALRYNAYVREGNIPISPEQRFEDDFDRAPNVWIFGIYLQGVLASSIRVHVASPECPISPCLTVFPEVLEPLIEEGKTIVDPTRFVVDREMARQFPQLPYLTVRLGFLASERFNADLGLASVRQEHCAFYRRLFGLQTLCEPRSYLSLRIPLGLMGANYLSVREQIVSRYPFMRSTPEELEALFDYDELFTRQAQELMDTLQKRLFADGGPANDPLSAGEIAGRA